MVPGLAPKLGLLDPKNRSQRNLSNALGINKLSPTIQSNQNSDLLKESKVEQEENGTNDESKNETSIKLSDVSQQNNLLEVKINCKYLHRLKL